MNITSHLLGDILVGMEIISKSDLDEALKLQQGYVGDTTHISDIALSELISRDRGTGTVPMLGQILVDRGIISEEQLVPALELQARRAKDLSMLDSRKLAIALELGFIINSTTSLVDVLSLIMKYACLVTDSMASTLMLRDEKTGELVFSIPTGPKADQLKDIRIPPGAGVAGWVAEHEEYVMVNDTNSDTRFYSGIDTMTGSRTRNLLCVPMRAKRKLIGVLEVLNKKDDEPFTEEDALLLNIFAHQAAIAIDNATLFSSLTDQLEREKRLKQEFADSERLRAIGTLAGGIAHDFNNILGIIMGNTELSLYLCKDDKQRKYLDIVLEQSLRGKDLTRNLMAFAKTQEVKLEFFDINERINRVIDLMKRALDGVELVLDYRPGTPALFADPGMIEHALVNLIQNAAHAMSLTGSPRLTIRTGLDEAGICVEIEDNGCGIPVEHQASIYAPSFTLKGRRDTIGAYKGGIKGTGYGMANVKKYIEQHNGTISLESRPGMTRFTLCLPVTAPRLTDKDKAELMSLPVQTGRRILLVEDEAALSEMQAGILSWEPFCHIVDTAATGKEALEFLSTRTYDLISLDYVLPGGISGLDIYHEIRRTDKGIPIIFISGNIDFLESIKDLKQNDPWMEHLPKPCLHKVYVDTVNRLLQNR